MILGAMTADFVVMVADRRLTYSETGKVFTDHENKVVVLAEEMILGYTGLGDLGGMPTDRWVTEALHGKQPEEYLTALVDSANAAINRVRVSRHLKRHAFLLMGWSWAPDAPVDYLPLTVLISNYHDELGNPQTVASPRFHVYAHELGRHRSWVYSVGRQLMMRERVALQRTITRYLHSNPGRPHGIVDLLARTVLSVAARDPGVGSELMMTCFPRQAVRTGFVVTMGDDTWATRLTSAYFGPEMGIVQYSPAYVSPSITTLAITVTHDLTKNPLQHVRGFPGLSRFTGTS